jgi:hypothetical protein
MFTVTILPRTSGSPASKLADAELTFTDPVCPACLGDQEIVVAESGPLAGGSGICAMCEGEGVLLGVNPFVGLKLVGFAVWESRTGQRTVTFPARSFSVNGERRSFALLRPTGDVIGQNRVRDLILGAYTRHEDEIVATEATTAIQPGDHVVVRGGRYNGCVLTYIGSESGGHLVAHADCPNRQVRVPAVEFFRRPMAQEVAR